MIIDVFVSFNQFSRTIISVKVKYSCVHFLNNRAGIVSRRGHRAAELRKTCEITRKEQEPLKRKRSGMGELCETVRHSFSFREVLSQADYFAFDVSEFFSSTFLNILIFCASLLLLPFRISNFYRTSIPPHRFPSVGNMANSNMTDIAPSSFLKSSKIMLFY